jgi:hypothetical protein
MSGGGANAQQIGGQKLLTFQQVVFNPERKLT